MFNAITLIQKVKSTINREKAASAQVDAKLTSNLEGEVFSELSKSLKAKTPPPVSEDDASRQDKLDLEALSNLTPSQKNKLLLALMAKEK